MIEAYFTHILILIGIWIILAISLNLSMGFTGLLNIGHIAFYGLGAYTSALLAVNFGVSFWLGMLAGGIVAALFSLILAIPCLKLKGDYLAIATLGFTVIIGTIFKNWISLTNGPLGIAKIAKPSIFGFKFTGFSYLLLTAMFVLIIYYLINKITSSPFGRILKAIREDELAIKSLGRNTTKYKTLALMISAFFAGIAGSLYAHYITFIDPSTFSVVEAIMVISMVIIGGLASLPGSVIGVFVIYFMWEVLRFFPIPGSMVGALRIMIFSFVLIVILLKRPRGFLGELKQNNGGKK